MSQLMFVQPGVDVLAPVTEPPRMSAPSTPTAPVPRLPIKRLPGGAIVSERWSSPVRVAVSIGGELDAFDQHGLLDLLTACILGGAREIEIDARAVPFGDVAVLRCFDRVGRFLARSHGSLELVGLAPLRDRTRLDQRVDDDPAIDEHEKVP